MKLKFRAWDKENKIMLYDREDICITGNGLVLFDWGNNAPNERYERTDNFIIHQYTGLKDKNGKEIYFGDLIKYPHPNYPNGKIVGVESEFSLLYEIIRVERYDENSLEIVGNIYENKDLL